MFSPRPYDGVIIEADVPGSTVVHKVVPGSGAHRAGIRQGDVIVGIDRSILSSAGQTDPLGGDTHANEFLPAGIACCFIAEGRILYIQVGTCHPPEQSGPEPQHLIV